MFVSVRGGLWRKGSTSGKWQELLKARVDCDSDSLLYCVKQVSVVKSPSTALPLTLTLTPPAPPPQHGSPPVFCHLGTRSCWGNDGGIASVERRLERRLDRLRAKAETHKRGAGAQSIPSTSAGHTVATFADRRILGQCVAAAAEVRHGETRVTAQLPLTCTNQRPPSISNCFNHRRLHHKQALHTWTLLPSVVPHSWLPCWRRVVQQASALALSVMYWAASTRLQRSWACVACLGHALGSSRQQTVSLDWSRHAAPLMTASTAGVHARSDVVVDSAKTQRRPRQQQQPRQRRLRVRRLQMGATLVTAALAVTVAAAAAVGTAAAEAAAAVVVAAAQARAQPRQCMARHLRRAVMMMMKMMGRRCTLATATERMSQAAQLL